MEKRDLNYWTNRIEDYVNKCALHLWVDDNKRFFKIIPFKVNGETKVASITFGNDYFRMKIDNSTEARSSQTLFFWKDDYFPQWTKKTSIPNFKRMRELTAMVKDILEKEYKSSEDLKKVEEKVKKLLEKEVFVAKS
jgi:hypothetical protein